MRTFAKSLIVVCVLLGGSICHNSAQGFQQDTFTQSQLDHFENKVRPILVKRCNECHAEGESEGSLSLASRAAMLEGGDSGPAIVPGDPEKSLLVQAIHYDDVYEMPPDSKMPDDEIRILEEWVRDSAPQA